MRVCSFEDYAVADLEPLTLTRPAFELICGQTCLLAKQCRYFAAEEIGTLVRPPLAELLRSRHPGMPINDLDRMHAARVAFVNGRWLPPVTGLVVETASCVGMIDDEIAFAVVGAEQLAECSVDMLEQCLETWKQSLPWRPAGGCLIRRPWNLIEHNAEQLRHDSLHYPRHGDRGTLVVVGPADGTFVDPTAKIDPFVVADTSGGPVVIDRAARIDAFTRLEGPCYIGPHSHVLGAKIRAGTTIGPHCRVGGEVEASILHGYSNKYHEGFLGHSYVGEWVNLGAGTQNSDLRNDYGEVRVIANGQPVATGLTKVGCFIGDHTKTGLGTLLNTGASIGVFCNVLSGGTMPKYVPSFCTWGETGMGEQRDLLGLLETAATVMRRRGCTLTQAHAALYRHLFAHTANERRNALREHQRRRLRRGA